MSRLVSGVHHHSVGASPAPPLRNIREYEQVHAREKHQGKRGHCPEAHPVSVLVFKHRDAVEDHDQCKGNGQPAVHLPNPLAPVQWDNLLSNVFSLLVFRNWHTTNQPSDDDSRLFDMLAGRHSTLSNVASEQRPLEPATKC